MFGGFQLKKLSIVELALVSSTIEIVKYRARDALAGLLFQLKR